MTTFTILTGTAYTVDAATEEEALTLFHASNSSVTELEVMTVTL